MMLNNPETASPEYLENLGKVKRGLTLNVILLWFALLMMTLAALRL